MHHTERRAIADIKVGLRHRTDMGDLDALSISISTEGLLQPIGILSDKRLVFGARRLMACNNIGWTEIDVRIVNVSSIAMGEMTENELRKQFTNSERVAIFRTIETMGRGTRTDRLRHHGNEVPMLTTEDAAKRAGFSGRGTAYFARTVVDDGIPEVNQAVDDGSIKVRAAREIVKHPPEVQATMLAKALADKATPKTKAKPTIKVKLTTPAKKKSAPQKPIDISHIVGHPPTLSREEAGLTPDMTWEEQAQHQEKYGKAQITPKLVRDMADAKGVVESRTDSLELLLSDIRPDADAYFAALTAMLGWTTDQRKPGYTGRGWETDYARMARQELAKLRRLLPDAIALLETYRVALETYDSAGAGDGVIDRIDAQAIRSFAETTL
jgi:ParB-like chromosome segregation protein Spo0J